MIEDVINIPTSVISRWISSFVNHLYAKIVIHVFCLSNRLVYFDDLRLYVYNC